MPDNGRTQARMLSEVRHSPVWELCLWRSKTFFLFQPSYLVDDWLDPSGVDATQGFYQSQSV